VEIWYNDLLPQNGLLVMPQVIDKQNFELNLEQLLSALPGNVVWKDINSTYMGSNQSFADLVGLETSQIEGKTDFDFLNEEKAKEIIENDRYVIESKQSLTFQEIAVDKYANEAIYLSKKVPFFDNEGEVVGVLVVAFDITEMQYQSSRLLSAARAKTSFIENMTYFEQIARLFNQLATTLPGNVYWKDKHGIYLGCNEALANLYRSALNGPDTSENPVVGLTLHDLLDQESADQLEKIDKEVMEAGVPLTLEEMGFDSEGNPATYMSNKVPVRDESGEVIGLLGLSIDITAQKKMEANLRAAKEKAEAANRAKSEFIMNMSHDIRTPFVGILGFAELLEEQEDDPSKREMLGYIRESGDRLMSLLNEIIDIVSSDSDKISKHQPVHLNQIIEEIVSVMRARVEHKGLALTAFVQPEVPELLYGSRVGLNRVLLNLVGNAIKFTNDGSVDIQVKIEREEAELLWLKFSVCDTGIGIPEDKKPLIFDRYTRLTSSYAGNYKGSGLGLYFVKKIVGQLGGKIDVESDLGKGSCFICHIPFYLTAPELIRVETPEDDDVMAVEETA